MVKKDVVDVLIKKQKKYLCHVTSVYTSPPADLKVLSSNTDAENIKKYQNEITSKSWNVGPYDFNLCMYFFPPSST